MSRRDRLKRCKQDVRDSVRQPKCFERVATPCMAGCIRTCAFCCKAKAVGGAADTPCTCCRLLKAPECVRLLAKHAVRAGCLRFVLDCRRSYQNANLCLARSTSRQLQQAAPSGPTRLTEQLARVNCDFSSVVHLSKETLCPGRLLFSKLLNLAVAHAG